MSATLSAGVAAAGAVGAVARFVVEGTAGRWRTRAFPVAVLGINVSGSLVLGVLTGLVLFHGADDSWRTVLGTGFCGGFTTFSTASYAAVRLAQDGRRDLAALQVLGSLALCTAAAVVGLALAAL